MLRELLETYESGKHYAEIEKLCVQLIADNDILRLDNARLLAENRQLRRRLKDADLRLLRRAQVDANMMVLMHLACSQTTRAKSLEYGISRRRWAWARALLKKSGCMDYAGEWMDRDIDGYESCLLNAVDRVERLGVDLLKLGLPKNGYSGKHAPKPVTRTVTRAVTRGAQNVTTRREKRQ
jgi:hypothetical protein